MIAWGIVGILLLFVLWQAFIIKTQYRKLYSLNEYTQFLLFNPKDYQDHRLKFAAHLHTTRSKNVIDQAMLSYRAIEGIALQMEGSNTLANTIKRAKPEDF